MHVTEAHGRVWHLYQIAERQERKTVIAKLLDGSGDPDVKRTLDTHGTVEIAQVQRTHAHEQTPPARLLALDGESDSSTRLNRLT